MDLHERILEASPETFWFAVTLAAVAALTAFFSAFRSLVRSRLIADTPTSKIRSAAQGYTELEGRVRLIEGTPIHAPLSGTPCVWYRYKIEEHRSGSWTNRQQSRWQTVERGVSDAIFHLQDETGTCIVDPEGAEVTPSSIRRWRGRQRHPRPMPAWGETGLMTLLNGNRFRYTEERVDPDDHLYAIGDFMTVGSHETVRTHEEVRAVLGRWKRDKQELLRRFDKDRNGEIDLDEWETARREAENEVRAAQRKRSKEPQLHLIKKPPARTRPFILSTRSQRSIIARYRLFAGVAAIAFLVVGASLTWAVNLRLNGG